MSKTEKKTSQQTLQAFLAMANFTEAVTTSSLYQTIHEDFQEVFQAAMLTDDADDFEFREKAILILQFTKYFSEAFKKVNWVDADHAAKELRDDVSLKIIGHE